MKLIEPPVVEPWDFAPGDFPDHIEIDGLVFNRAIRQQGYDGVICQYRQAVPRDSAHLLVLNDGRYVIDHIDSYNPDMGYPVRHFVVDHPMGKSVIVAGVGVLGVVGSVLAGLADKNNSSTSKVDS